MLLGERPSGALEVFVFHRGRFVGSRVFQPRRVITVGSAKEADIRLSASNILPIVASISLEGDAVCVKATADTIWVDGEDVRSAVLTPLSEVRIGDFRLKAEWIAAVHEDATAIAPRPEHVRSSKEERDRVRGADADAGGGVGPGVRMGGTAARAHSSVDAIEVASDGEFLAIEDSDEVTSPHSPSLPSSRMVERPSQPPFALGIGRGEYQYGSLAYDFFDDEDDEEQSFVQPFSLLDSLVRDRFRASGRLEARQVVEVIHYRGEHVIDVGRVARGQTFRMFNVGMGRSTPLLVHKKQDRARVFYREGMHGNLVIEGQTLPLLSVLDDKHLVDRKKRVFAIDLTDRDFAHVRIQEEGYLMRFVRAPAPPPKKLAVAVEKDDRRYVASALLGMALVLAAMWIQALLSPPELFAMEEPVEFAEVSLKELALEKPEEPPPPPPEPEPVVEEKPPEPPPPPVTQPPPEPPPPPKERPQKRAQKPERAAPPPPPQRTAAQQEAESALSALSGLVPQDANRQLSQRVSNIAAVKVPRGSAKSFQFSGPASKLPAGEVVLMGGGQRATRGATQLLSDQNVAQLSGGGGSGKVRGTVARPPPRSIATTGGHLSREEILKVVNAAIGDIQRCYERELLKAPGIGGKIVFDWVIAANGSVSSARVRSSSMSHGEAVASCIGGVIRGLRFPKPTGGAVTVTFPFTFRAQAF